MVLIATICMGIGAVLLTISMKCGGVTEEGYPCREKKHNILRAVSCVFQLIGVALLLISLYR